MALAKSVDGGRQWRGPVVVTAVLVLVALTAVAGAVWRTDQTGGTRPDAGPAYPGGIVPASASGAPKAMRYVSPNGSDRSPGSASRPWRTLGKALPSLRPGDRLVVAAGTYTERLKHLSLRAGTKSEPIQVVAAPGARPVLRGLLWLRDPDYWAISGLNVTWSSSSSGSEHMVKFDGGTGWSFTQAEVWGAHSYAAILVTGAPRSWLLSGLYVHDTHRTHGTNQDHLIYVSSGTGGGVIERCLLANSANGRAVKIGPPSSTGAPVGNVTIRFNTMWSNLGPSNVQLSRRATDTRIYRNILVRSSPGSSSITTYELVGRGSIAFDNLSYQSAGVMDRHAPGLRDAGGNIRRNPRLVDPAHGDFRPRDPTAMAYGRYADSAP